MRRGKMVIYLALFFLILLGGAFLFLKMQQPTQTETTGGSATSLVNIVIAQQNIPQGAEITEEALGVISLPSGEDYGVMFRDDMKDTELIGKYARYPIEPGVVITTPMITSEGFIELTPPQWAKSITSGMTAVSIPIDRLSSVAYGTADGAHVNLVACFLFVDVDSGFQSKTPNQTAFVSKSGFIPEEAPSLSASVSAGQTSENAGAAQGRVELDPTFQQPIYVVPSEEQRPRPVCQTILQDITVLKLGEFAVDGVAVASDTPDDEPPPPPDEEQAPAVIDIISLIVTPQDATSLIYMLNTGRVQLSLTLRGANDTSRVETEAATLQFLLSQYAIPVPAKLPYAFEPRIDNLDMFADPQDNGGE